MENIIRHLDELIRAVSEGIHYSKIKKYDKTDSIFRYISGEFEKNVDLIKCVKDELLTQQYLEVVEEKNVYNIDFLKKICKIKEYILNNYQIDISLYCNENLELLLKKDKELYNSVLDDSITCGNDKRKYQIDWNRVFNISMMIETGKKEKINMCSFGNTWQEAILYAQSIKKDTDVCVIFGFGLGYHVQETAMMHPDMEIYVLESDIEQIRTVLNYRNISDILANEKIHIIYCSEILDYAKLLRDISEEYYDFKIDCKMWMPSIKAIENDELRELLEQYKVSFFSVDYFKDTLLQNFDKNILLNDDNIDEIRKNIENKTVILVAAGPSLESELKCLKRVLKSSERENICVICVGKISKRLFAQDIIPDYIAITDAKESTKWQTNGIENSGVPLLYLSTAAANVVCSYTGKRYIAYQNGFEKAEKMAEQKKDTLFDTGGSVATFIVDIALKFRCLRLVCIGLDLGYIGENSHALGIGKKIVNKKRLKMVESVGGGKICTSMSLDLYRKWIEKRISNEKNTDIINASHGVRIKGMKEKSLEEIFQKKYEVLAVIPARSGSKSVKDKNIRPIAGKPMIAYSIEHALKSPSIDRVIVSTDSRVYADIAEKFGAEVPFIRPAEYATDTALDIDVFKHALNFLKEKENYVPDIVVQLRPTYPIRDIQDIENMIKYLIEHPEADSVRCVAPAKEIPYKMWFMNEEGLLAPVMKDIPECYNMPRQQLPKVYYQNACIDVFRTTVVTEKNSMTGDIIAGYQMKENFDIDTEEDFLRASESINGDLENGIFRKKS
jgi:hypothetical protein